MAARVETPGRFQLLGARRCARSLPEDEIDDFEALGPYNAVDPSWSLERMIETIVRKRAVLRGLAATAARQAARLATER